MCGSVKLSFWNSKLKMNALGVLNQLFHKLAADVRQPKVAALETVGQFGGIEAEQVQQGGVQVMNGNLVPRRVETKRVGLAEGDAGPHTAAGQPHGKAIRVVIAPVVAALHHRGAAEFAAPDD